MNPFESIPVGDYGAEVTRLGMGGVFISGRGPADGSAEAPAYETGLATIAKAHEVGIKYFDTAPLYGNGRSEARYGKVLGRYPRDSFVLSSKVGRVLVPDEDDPGEWAVDGIPHLTAKFDLSRDGILRALDEGLERSGLDHVEILYLHDPDVEDMEDEAIATAFPTMIELREQGVVKAIGTGMNQWQMPARFVERFDLDIILLAGRYTLLDHDAYPEFLPLCVERNVKIATGGPYNSGILAAQDLDGPLAFNYEQAAPQWIEKARGLKRVCDAHGVDMRAAALQFPLAHPAVASVIPGAATPEQVVENVEFIRTDIPDAMWADMKSEGLIPADAPTP
ncbi:MAG: aldo/keto reductase [Chloroflexi bacterium]|nr:aldo/keto reductase [Chloroflexota bacterium]MBT4514359.1 aldo/keto reductase [Chloroflexota bacterium]